MPLRPGEHRQQALARVVKVLVHARKTTGLDLHLSHEIAQFLMAPDAIVHGYLHQVIGIVF
jgi:hypothetical protein